MADNADYGLIGRLKALRDLLRQGECAKTDICRQLPSYYQLDAAGSRRLGRDVRALRQLGYGVVFDRTSQTYLLQEVGHLELSQAEVQALGLIREAFEGLTPKSGEVLTVLGHIVLALPERQRRFYYQRSPVAIRLRPAVDYRPHARAIRLLEEAIGQSRKVYFEYPALDDGQPEAHLGVEPYELQFLDRHFYLIGFSPRSPQIMEFRIDRIRKLELLPGRTAGRRRRATYHFQYRLSPRIARQGVSERFLNQRLEPQADGSVIIHAEGYSDFRILQDLLRYGEQAELLVPARLRAKMAEVVQAMAHLYASK
jgi:predicted DNA-binding transcriptional regulator YafY